jgi:Mn2+/Fe2+ NRAMP family transporter
MTESTTAGDADGTTPGRSTGEIDPYTQVPGATMPPPQTFLKRVKHLGPSVIVSGSIVGSGEIFLTSGLGATAGFVLLWWVFVACWSKSVVQAELTRYCITTGDTYMRALHRVPGRLPGPRGPVGWPIWMAAAGFFIGVPGLGGIVGGAGQGLELLTGVPAALSAAIIAIIAMIILATGSYRYIERIMLFLVIGFTATTILSAVMMQFTEFRLTSEDVAIGFAFDFPLEYAALAIAMYGYTGVNSGEIAAYTYWCVEKGYPKYIGANRDDPNWVGRAKGWIKVLQTDVWATLIILTFATVPFFVLGAGVLFESGAKPEGIDTVRVLSSMFTETLGEWSIWVFGLGAFFILFSTTLSGVGAGGRVFPDYAIEFGFADRQTIRRAKWTRIYVIVVPLLAYALYIAAAQRPILLIQISATFAALTLPIQSGATLFLQKRHMDPRVRPGLPMHIALWATFVFQLSMTIFVLWFLFFS